MHLLFFIIFPLVGDLRRLAFLTWLYRGYNRSGVFEPLLKVLPFLYKLALLGKRVHTYWSELHLRNVMLCLAFLVMQLLGSGCKHGFSPVWAGEEKKSSLRVYYLRHITGVKCSGVVYYALLLNITFGTTPDKLPFTLKPLLMWSFFFEVNGSV